MTLVLTPKLLFFSITALTFSVLMLLQFVLRYRRKSRCLDDIERLTAPRLAKIDARRKDQRRIKL